MLTKAISLLVAVLLSFNSNVLAQGSMNDLQKNESYVSQNIVYENWFDQKRNREIPVKIYFPDKFSSSTPVVIFSHGLGGNRDAATYLGEYWSKYGYFCIFPQHHGSDTAVWQSAVGGDRFKQLEAAANETNLINRALDIKFVIDELERRNQSDSRIINRLNLNEIAMTGHSFGAGTTLALAGQRFAIDSTFVDDRIKSAIYLCPPVRAGKANPAVAYGDIKIPGLLLTGTEDRSPIGDTQPYERRIPFDNIKAPHQYLVNFIGADHAAFGGASFRLPKESDKEYHKMIQEVTVEFLDATLKNDPNAWQWLNSDQCASFLGKTAIFERK